MAGDEDIARSLPAPPLPAPAPREAAIGAALRRFDGAEPSPSPASRPQRGWRANRPQLGALAGLSLALLVGVPLAVQTMNDRPQPSAAPERARADAPESAAALARQDAVPTAPPPGDAREPSRTDAGAAIFPEEKRTVAAPPPAPTVQSGKAAAPPSFDLAGAEQPWLVAPAAPIITGAAPAAPPPPPTVAVAQERSPMLEASDRAAAIDVVVTGARAARQPRSVDAASACTIDDPRHRLDLCRAVIDPAAPGREGRAAAHIADGLASAWEGDLDGAVAAFDRAIAIAPRSAIAYLNRGLIRQRRGDLDAAIADLDRAAAYAPNSTQVNERRSRLLLERDDPTKPATGRK